MRSIDIKKKKKVVKICDYRFENDFSISSSCIMTNNIKSKHQSSVSKNNSAYHAKANQL